MASIYDGKASDKEIADKLGVDLGIVRAGRKQHEETQGYRRVEVTFSIVDNGQDAGYLKLMWPDGTFCKVFPDDWGLYDALQATLNAGSGASESESGVDERQYCDMCGYPLKDGMYPCDACGE